MEPSSRGRWCPGGRAEHLDSENSHLFTQTPQIPEQQHPSCHPFVTFPLILLLPARIPERLILKHAKWCHIQTPGKIQKTSSQTAAGCRLHRSLQRKFQHEWSSPNYHYKKCFWISNQKKKKKTNFFLLTENFTCSCNKIICFGIFIYDSNQELTFNIKLSLPPENKVKPSLMSYCKCYGMSKQSAEATYVFSLYLCLLFHVAYHTSGLFKNKCLVLFGRDSFLLIRVIFYLYSTYFL